MAPSATSEAPLAALRNRHFAALGQQLTAEQRAFERDPAVEEAVDRGFAPFAACDANDAVLLEESVKSDPQSFAPHLARAVYLFHRGWAARGNQGGDETSDNQIESMEGYFRDGATEAMAALKIDQHLAVAYRLMILAERTSASLDAIGAVAQAGLKQTPASFAIREGFMLTLLPRWGGSHDSMERFAADSQSYEKQNPRLHLLRGDSSIGIVAKRSSYGTCRGLSPTIIARCRRAATTGDFT